MKFNRLHWWILSIVVFAVALVGALAFNVALVNRSRTALASTVLRNPADIKTARFHLVAILPDTTDPFFAQLEEALREEAEHQNAALQVFCSRKSLQAKRAQRLLRSGAGSISP